MAEGKFEKGSGEWQLFQDYWKLCRRFWIPEEEDIWWEEFIGELKGFTNKYKNDSFARALAMALSDEVERKHRKN